MSFKVDYDERTEFPNLDPGRYDATIHSCRPEVGPKGNFLALRFSVENDELNRQAWLNLSLAPGALWKVTKTLKDLGLADGEREYKSRNEFETEVVEMLTGTPCRIEIAHEEYDEVLRDRVVRIERRHVSE